MQSVTMELENDNGPARESIKTWLLYKAQAWINSLLQAEMDEHLRRKRYEPCGKPGDRMVQPSRGTSAATNLAAAVTGKGSTPNYRNGSRPRKLNLLGLGTMALKIPRDRQGTYRSRFLPERRGQDESFEAFVAECFLAGLSTRDITRISAKHLGKRYDSKQVSRIVARASSELEQWQQRCLSGTSYKFLFVDGANFRVRIDRRVSKQSFCAVLGISEKNQTYEVLGLTMGDREQADLWSDIFSDLARRGLDMKAVELGIMDGLPGLEDVFRRCFPQAQTQRCQVHVKRNALRRVRKSDREAFSKDLNTVFYAPSEAEARKNFHRLQATWHTSFPGAVSVIERDLDSLLRFFQFDPMYWTTIRTTNPIERLNKEFKRRTKAMEVTGGEASTYRILAYVAMTIEYEWSFHPVTQWAQTFGKLSNVYTQDAA